jgi:hypothetical protein
MEQEDLLALYAATATPEREATYNNLSRDVLAEMTVSGICPLCQGPMTARYHPRRGPYFHCHCTEQEESLAIVPVAGKKGRRFHKRRQRRRVVPPPGAVVVYPPRRNGKERET